MEIIFQWIVESKKRIQAVSMVAGILLIFLFTVKSQMLVTEEYEGPRIRSYQAMPLICYVVLSGLICLMLLWKGRIKNKFVSQLMAVLSLIIMPFVSFFVFEMVAENFFTVIHNTQKGMIILNLNIWYAIYGIVLVLSNRVKITILAVNTITYIFAVANAFVVQFREQPIMPMDLKSFRTAMSVAGEFQYEPTVNMVLMGLVMVLCNLWIWKAEFRFPGWKSRLAYCVVSLGCIYYCFYGMLAGDFFEKAGSPWMDFFRFNLTYQVDGYMASTIKSIRFLHVEEPEGYSAEKVNEIASKTGGGDKTGDLPENIIVIMNESFSDLSVLGDFKTSEPVLPCFKEMKSYTSQGNVYVSVYGGGTANSEFEFFTGNSVAFIPAGTVAFQMYVEEGDSSLVSLLKEHGYRTVAYHPFRKDNYNRLTVYDIYGFDEYYGKGDIKFKKLRNYASDKSDYQGLIQLYENKVPGERLFLYNVTMQNHAGYDYKDYDSTIFLADYPGEFPETEQYLSLMHESDQALQELIEYFSQVKEKTVILLFGDHQPALEDGFYQRVMGAETAENSFEHFQRKFITPYVLWSNYELDVEEKENISTNYLGSYLLDAIGVELPVYNRYLLELREKIPAVNVNGFLDDQGTMHWIGETGSEYEEVLAEYRMFEYNNLFDGKDRLENVYE